MTDIDFEKHFSERAKKTIAKDISPILVDASFSMAINEKPTATTTKINYVDNEAVFEFLLEALKHEAKLCSGVESNSTISGNSAYLTCSEEDYKDQYGESYDSYQRTVSFVNENGWRIDTVETQFFQESGTMKLTTFK